MSFNGAPEVKKTEQAMKFWNASYVVHLVMEIKWFFFTFQVETS